MKWIFFLLLITGCQLGFYQRLTLTKDPETKLCFLGDVGRDSPTQAQVAEALKTEKCHAIYFTGDIIYPGGLHGPNDKEAEKKFFKYYRPLTMMDHRPQLHIALGNHDYHNNADVWTQISRGDPSVYAPARYYFEEFPPVCLVVLDTQPINQSIQYIRNEGQINWLNEQQPKFKDCPVKIAIGHHPYRNSITRRGPARGPLKKFLETYVVGVFDFYIAGHDHIMSYEGKEKGTEQFISGAGGTPDKGHLPGYLTMTVSKDQNKTKVLTTINKINSDGMIEKRDFQSSF